MVKEPIRSQADGVGDPSVLARTGRARQEWFALLDAAGAVAWGHPAIARWLTTEHGVDGWWAQGITVSYEQARGLRAPGQRPDGTFEAGVSRTVLATAEECLAWVTEPDRRGQWLDVDPQVRGVSRTVRWTLPDGSRVTVAVQATGADRSRVTVTHHGLPDAASLAERKEYWAERLDLLKELLAQ